MNLANAITVSRFPMLFVVSALLYWPFPGARTLAFFIYLAVGLTDWLDGYIARRYAMVSNFGKFMDALSDKILVLGLFVLFLTTGTLPKIFVFLVLLLLGREFFITGLRLVAMSRNVVIAAEKSGKVKTLVQMVAIGSLIFAQMMGLEWNWFPFNSFFMLFFHLFGIALFLIGVYCALDSAVRYTRRYRYLFVNHEENKSTNI